MISDEGLRREIAGLDPADLRRWIAAALVRPAGGPERPRFTAVDVARVRLIVELRDELEVDEAALPVVLSLLDQLHEARRQMRRMRDAIAAAAPEEVRVRILTTLTATPPEAG